MKRLSELPERDKADETQKLTGNNPVKLLVNSPTEDVLVKPEDLLPKITGVSGSSDTWANLEQIKEAYEKGPEIKGTIEIKNIAELINKYFPNYIDKDKTSIFLNLPNVTLRPDDNHRYILPSTLLPNKRLKEYNLIFKTQIHPDFWRLLFSDSGFIPEKITITILGSGTQAPTVINPYHYFNITNTEYVLYMPNATQFYGNIFISSYYNFNFSTHTITFICPEVTTFTHEIDGNSIKRSPFKIKFYLPKLNSSFTFMKLAAMDFDSIKYLLDYINKAPSNGHRDYPYTSFTVLQNNAIAASEAITIKYTDSNGTQQTLSISDVPVNTGERLVDNIAKKLMSDPTLKAARAFAWSTSQSKLYISAPYGSTIDEVESTSSYVRPTDTITPKEDTAGQPLLISCGVDESLGTYVDSTDKSKGWIPTGTFGDYIGQFLLDCAGKWNIIWYPVTHA